MKDVFLGDVTIIKAHENNPQDPCDWYFYLLIHHKYQPRMLIPYVDPMGKLSVIRCLFPSFQQKKMSHGRLLCGAFLTNHQGQSKKDTTHPDIAHLNRQSP